MMRTTLSWFILAACLAVLLVGLPAAGASAPAPRVPGARASVTFYEGDLSLPTINGVPGARGDSQYGRVALTLQAEVTLRRGSVVRIVYPATALQIPQYGWTLSNPFASHWFAPGETVPLDPAYAQIDTARFSGRAGMLSDYNTRIPYIELVARNPVGALQPITVTLQNPRMQALPAENNLFQFFVDLDASNDYQRVATAAFNVFGKPANSVKVFVDTQYQHSRGRTLLPIQVNVTPIDTSTLDTYRYPTNDELYNGYVVLREGHGSTARVTWPDGSMGGEFAVPIQRLTDCVRNCTTTTFFVTSQDDGFFYLEARVPNGTYDGTYGVSNPSSSNFYADTSFANKTLAFGDWHAHYWDNRATLRNTVEHGRLGFKADFIGGSLKANHDSYPQLDQIDERYFREYVKENELLNASLDPGNFVTIQTEEWQKVISYYQPYRTSHTSFNPDVGTFWPLSWFWIHQAVLFRSAADARLFSQESPEYANFYDLVATAREQGTLLIPHHMTNYPWTFYDGATQPVMRLFGFDRYEGYDRTGGLSGADQIWLQGAKIGVVGESDSHQGTSAEGGVTGLFVDVLSRPAILQALRARETYAATAFGRPLVYFELAGPAQATLGQEAVLPAGARPVFRIKAALSRDIESIIVRRGRYGERMDSLSNRGMASLEEIDVTAQCVDMENPKLADCLWTEPLTKEYNVYMVMVASDEEACRGQAMAAHCAFTSPIWLSRAEANYAFGDAFNVVATQADPATGTATVMTKFSVAPGPYAKNFAIALSNLYPQAADVALRLSDFQKEPVLNDPDWYLEKVMTGEAIDFKVRYVDGQYAFYGVDLNAGCNPADDTCLRGRVLPGENKSLYINVDRSQVYSTYSNVPYPCTDITTAAVCTYAHLDGRNSSITVRDDGTVEIVWALGFERVLGERIYELYSNAWVIPQRSNSWRRVGSVLVNPTTPSGQLRIVDIDPDGVNVTLASEVSPSDEQYGARGYGNLYFRVTDVGAGDPCVFKNEDWYASYVMDLAHFPDYTVPYKLQGPPGPRKLCYYWKDAYGLQSEIQTLDVTKGPFFESR